MLRNHSDKRLESLSRRGRLGAALVSFLALHLGAVWAEARSVRFQNLSNVDGLSQVSAFALEQDAKGFLWIGTEDGLNRYDGLGFRVFRHRPEAPDSSLLPGAIQALYQDSADALWVGMRSGGFSRFDLRTERFEHFLQPGTEWELLGQFEISSFAEDRQGRLWIGTRGAGLLKLDLASLEIARFQNDLGRTGSLSHDGIEALAARDGVLWIGTAGGGLNRLELDQPSGVPWVFEDWRPSGAGGGTALADDIRALAMAPQKVWIGTDGGGLFSFDLATETLSAHSTGSDPGERSIWSLVLGDTGDLWIGTHGSGLTRLDTVSGEVEHYRYDSSDQGSLRSNEIRSLLEDRSGNLWVGTWTRGIHRNHPDELSFSSYRHDPQRPESLSSGIVMSLHEDREGTLWIGTTEGLSHRPRGAKPRRLIDGPLAIFDELVILALAEDGEGHLWVGTPGTVFRVDPSRSSYKAFRFDPAAADNQSAIGNLALHFDLDGNLWIGSYRGLGRLVPSTGAFRLWRHDPDDSSTLSHDHVATITASADGGLWVATLGGLNYFEPASERFTRIEVPAESTINLDPSIALHEDAQGALWVGTFGAGLVRFDRSLDESDPGRFTHFTEADGLANLVIWMILEDEVGALWLSTAHGLHRLDTRTSTFKIYDPADGLLDFEYNVGAACHGDGGVMYFGNVQGVDSFRPARYRENLEPPPVVLSGFRIFQDEAALEVAAPYVERIELSHQENFFTFEFAALNFRRADRNRFQYRLEGFDDGWRETRTLPVATYTKVAPGEYIFRVRASNNDGVWNETGTQVRVIVRAPLWARWWAKGLYLLVVGLAIWGYVLSQRRRAARDQALVSRLREVDRLKDEILANTSHELRSPLFGMTGLAESLIDGARGDLSAGVKEDLEMIASSGWRLTSLINDILDFSKLRHKALSLRRQAVDLRAMADVVLTLSKPFVRDDRLALVNAVPGDLPAVYADEGRLQQILHNLVSNATKFTDSGEVRVAAEALEGRVAISVSDTGIGVAKETQERIFEAFEQADGSPQRHRGGTGLGLAVTRHLVALHGGELALESELGAGSTFSFSLPIADGKAPRHPVHSSSTIPLVAHAPGVRDDEQAKAQSIAPRARILVVDDEPVNRQVLKNYLATRYFEVETATGGSEALDLIEEDGAGFDLILLDIMMPKMSGYEVARAIRGKIEATDLPIILLTALGQSADQVAGFEAGANDYLVKPVDKDVLLARVEMHLELTWARRRLAKLLREKTHQVEELGVLLPICGSCKRVRNDSGYWGQVEEFIRSETGLEFSHGLCPNCLEEGLEEIQEAPV